MKSDGHDQTRSQHIAAFGHNPATRVVAISSRSLDSAQRRAREAGLREAACYDNLETALTLKQGVSSLLVASCHAIDALRWFAATGIAERPLARFFISRRICHKSYCSTVLVLPC